MSTPIAAIGKDADKIRIFIDGQSVLANSVTRKLLENHNIRPENILVNTYNRLDSQTYVDWLDKKQIQWFKKNYQDTETFELIKKFQPDYIISAYGLRVIPKEILNLARVVPFNLHPSYLPDYKGRWIPSWVIINGEVQHGITIHVMDEGIDTGPILFQKRFSISIDDTAYSLYNKIMCKFIEIFDVFFQDLVNGNITSKVMPSGGRYFGKTIPFDGIINPSWNNDQVEKFIRAMFYPPHRGAILKKHNTEYECLTLQDYVDINNFGHPRP